LGSDHIDDRRTSCGDLGLCSTCPAGSIRSSHESGGVILNEKGSAIVSAIAGISMATLISLSTLALGFSAINTMVIRDAAIEAASRSALAEGQGQREYLVKLLDENLPSLASYEVSNLVTSQLTGYRVEASLPGLGVIPMVNSVVEVAVTREAFS
jgi:hypothetical protein